MDHIKKADEGSEDDQKRQHDEVQKITDSFIVQIDKIAQAKEKEILTVLARSKIAI